MKFSAWDHLKRLEAQGGKPKLNAYWDRKQWSIGFGTKSYKGETITPEEADRRMKVAVKRFEHCVNRYINVRLTQNQFDALVSFAYNVGCGALKRSTLRRKLNSGNYDAVPRELMRWIKPRSLRKRRRAEIALWNGPSRRKGASPMAFRPTQIIVHCAATPEGKDFTVSQIARWHKKRGFSGRGGTYCGYHFVIYRDGSVHRGKPEGVRGTHTRRQNRNSLGICYIGGVDRRGKAKDTRTAAQKRAMKNLIQELASRHNITKIRGHRDYAAKACPSFDARSEYSSIRPGRKFVDKPITESRIAFRAGAAGGGGAVLTTDSALGLMHTARDAQSHIEVGDVLGLLIGLATFLFAVGAVYARWDDAGRPSMRTIWREFWGKDPNELEV
jgi:N-acetylmuramoyl-L-alanine amidase